MRITTRSRRMTCSPVSGCVTYSFTTAQSVGTGQQEIAMPDWCRGLPDAFDGPQPLIASRQQHNPEEGVSGRLAKRVQVELGSAADPLGDRLA